MGLKTTSIQVWQRQSKLSFLSSKSVIAARSSKEWTSFGKEKPKKEAWMNHSVYHVGVFSSLPT